MLARLFLLSFLLVSWVFFTTLLPGWLALFLGVLTLFAWVLLNFYPDKFLLHYLQARETIERDQPSAYRIARAQAYKFKITAPRIYSYSGFFHRAFAFAARGRLVFVVEKKTLELAQEAELEALFFALSLEAHERVAKKHTLALLLLALAWAPPLKALAMRGHTPKTMGWGIQFLIAPLGHALYKMAMPSKVWRKFLATLAGYRWEEERLRELNAKLDQPRLEMGPTRLFNFRFHAAGHAAAQQMILAIEGAPHPLDVLAGVEHV